MRVLFLFLMLLTGCVSYIPETKIPEPEYITTAYGFIGLDERTHRKELKRFLGVDPKYTEWCAAFVGSILEFHGYPKTNSYLARSYLNYGDFVYEPEIGDIIIFSRGNSNWQGHVGFFISKDVIDGKEYYWVLGGNQGDKISVEVYSKSRMLGIRRPKSIP